MPAVTCYAAMSEGIETTMKLHVKPGLYVHFGQNGPVFSPMKFQNLRELRFFLKHRVKVSSTQAFKLLYTKAFLLLLGEVQGPRLWAFRAFLGYFVGVWGDKMPT